MELAQIIEAALALQPAYEACGDSMSCVAEVLDPVVDMLMAYLQLG